MSSNRGGDYCRSKGSLVPALAGCYTPHVGEGAVTPSHYAPYHPVKEDALVTHYIRKRSITKTCSRCGVSEPEVEFYHASRVCKPCSVLRATAYKAAHRDQYRQHSQTFYRRHKVRLNKLSTVYRLKRQGRSPDDPTYLATVATQDALRAHLATLSLQERALHRKALLAAQGRRYRARHAATIRAQKRRAKQTPRGRTSHNVSSHRRRARKRALPASYSLPHWHYALDFWHHACAVCGAQEGLWWTLAMDHWIPLASPDCPGTVPWNIVPLCNGATGCNNRKGGKPPQDWLLTTFLEEKGTKILRRIQRFLHHMAVTYKS